MWVGDVDALYQRVVRHGIDAKPPAQKFYGVRILQVTDPEGYTWGFMQRSPFTARAPVMG